MFRSTTYETHTQFANHLIPSKIQKDAARRQKHTELRLKQAQAIAHLGSWELNLMTGRVEWSEEACRIYGLHPTENVQSYNSFLSFIHPDDIQSVSEITKRGQETFEDFSFNYRIVRMDGAIRHIFGTGQFEFNESGRPVYLYGIAHDITELKETEMALRRSEANLRLIVDLMPQHIFAKDHTGKFAFVNKSFAELYGLTPNEMINRSVDETIPLKEEAPDMLQQDKEVAASGKIKTIPEQSFTDRKGNKRIFNTVKVPYNPVGSDETLVLGIATDITEQKKAETERTKMIAEIVQRNNDLEKFSYIVSHNLRAPVANIMGLSDILQMPGLNENDKKDLTGKLDQCSCNLDEVVQDLHKILQVGHNENGQKEWVALSATLAEAESGFGDLIRKEGITVVSDFSAIDNIFTINSYLFSIFFSLISNSIKFRRPGVTPRISIKSRQHNGKTMITFTDNGMGIDLEKRRNEVFGLYKRFHPQVDGKGMGLFMVKTQVESLGGKISVSSEVNSGTEFEIEFPVN